MTWRTTRAGLSTLTLLSLALLLGVISGRAELFLAGVPLALRLLAMAQRPALSRYTLSHELSSTRLLEGEHVTVTMTLVADTGSRRSRCSNLFRRRPSSHRDTRAVS
jgi:uncharacterized protein (DUF58 family)